MAEDPTIRLRTKASRKLLLGAIVLLVVPLVLAAPAAASPAKTEVAAERTAASACTTVGGLRHGTRVVTVLGTRIIRVRSRRHGRYLWSRRRVVYRHRKRVVYSFRLSDCATGSTSSPTISTGTSPAMQQAAVATYEALQQGFYEPPTSLYGAQPSAPCGSYSCLWPFTNATAATLFLLGTPDGSAYAPDAADRLVGLTHYADPLEQSPTGAVQPPAYESAAAPPLGPGGSTYYDDNAWVGLDLIQDYLLTSSQAALSLAQDAFNFAATGWDASPSDPCPGGVFWEDVAGSQRNVSANGANAELGLELYRITGDASDLVWATQMYQWVVTCLGNPDGLYSDHINADGSLATTVWSYNQGVMIGAGVLLAEITGNQSYLVQAQRTAEAAVNHFGAGTALTGQGPAFNAIYFRNLLFLNQVAPDSAYVAEAQSYAATMWAQRQSTGLIDPTDGVNGTAPMVEIFSLLAGSPPLP